MNKKQIFIFLSSYLERLKRKQEISNFSFYGSFNSEEELVDSEVADLDFILLFNTLDKKSLNIINTINSETATFLGKNFLVRAGYYYGAYKPEVIEGKINIFLHINAHTLSSLWNRHVFYKWGISLLMDENQKEEFGLEFMPRPTHEDFLSTAPGTPNYHLACTRKLNQGVAIPCRLPPDYVIQEVTLKHRNQLIEYCVFSVRMSLVNFLSTQGIDLTNLSFFREGMVKKHKKDLTEIIGEVNILKSTSSDLIDLKQLVLWSSKSLIKLIRISSNA